MGDRSLLKPDPLRLPQVEEGLWTRTSHGYMKMLLCCLTVKGLGV